MPENISDLLKFLSNILIFTSGILKGDCRKVIIIQILFPSGAEIVSMIVKVDGVPVALIRL